MKKILGIEFGSTRIKSVLINEYGTVLSKGSHEWENTIIDGYWSYSLDSIEKGLQASYADLSKNYQEKYNESLTEISAIGISAMMHGYMPFDENYNLLVPFRTWRNTNAEKASSELTELFEFHVPIRWSVSHYYQAVLNGEKHVKDVRYLNTLEGYVHYRLTNERVIGIGEASGMFPIKDRGYHPEMISKFENLLKEKGVSVSFADMLPKILVAGECAGYLTEEGAKFLDPMGNLKPGAVFCAPEGDAETGMVATNCIAKRSANVSAGTSAFLMAVLEKPLESYYKEIDVIATPTGHPVAMVHVNNFGSEITALANFFEEIITLFGGNADRNELFSTLYKIPLEADANCGGLVGYNFISPEPIVNVKKGIPMIIRSEKCKLSVANLMKMQIYSSLGALAMGCKILDKENVKIDRVCAHGGFFKTPDFTGGAMSAAIGAPITLTKTASEGGAYGIALLALFSLRKETSLEDFLDNIFEGAEISTVSATDFEKKSFDGFMQKYEKGLSVEKVAEEIYGNASKIKENGF